MNESVRLVVSMGIPCKNFESKKEGHKYDKAIIQVLDWNNKDILKEVFYVSPKENLGEGLSMQFKGATIKYGKLYVVTNTEVLIYDISTWKLLAVFSEPSFNDLHYVLPKDGLIYVCNTGLELVQVIDEMTSQVIQTYDLASEGIYSRFDKGLDFRHQGSTKPHRYHINHLFLNDNKVWVTYGNKCKAVLLDNTSIGFDFRKSEKEEVHTILGHDGLVKNGYIYFTTVNGHIVIVDAHTRNIIKDIDLNEIVGDGFNVGWTRGIEVVGDYAYVGLTKLRHSKFKEYSKWLLTKRSKAMPSGILKIDLINNKVVDFFEIKGYQGAAIYSIINYI